MRLTPLSPPTVWAAVIAAAIASAHAAPQEGAAAAPPALDTDAPWELTLEHALRLALADNLGLERARAEAEAARFDARSSWGAFDWTFAATTSYRDAEVEGATALAGGRVIETESADVAFDLTRPFSYGGRFEARFDKTQSETNNAFFNAPRLFEDNLRFTYIHPLLRGAGFEVASSQQLVSDLQAVRSLEAARGAEQTLVTDVANAYWDHVAALDQREVRRSALELGRNQLKIEEQRFAAGDGTEVDVLQAKTQIATRTEQLLQSENQVATAADALRALLLDDQDAPGWRRALVPMTPLPPVADPAATPTWEDAWQLAQERRSELRQARQDVEAARVRLRRASADRLAGLDMTMSLGAGANDEVARVSSRDTFQFDFPTWSVQLRYEVPLANTAAVNAEHAARERVRSALIQHAERELEVLADVRRAVREVEYRAAAVQASQESLDLALRQLEAERARFEAELSTTFRVLEFQQSWIEAASNARRARADYAKALSDLERAMGTAGEGR